MSLQCAIARLAAARSYSYFRIDERARLSDERGSFRVTFYDSPPKGIPVLDNLQGEDLPAEPVLMTAVLNAEEIVEACTMMDNRSKTEGRPH
jgi:hypothetical protein